MLRPNKPIDTSLLSFLFLAFPSTTTTSAATSGRLSRRLHQNSLLRAITALTPDHFLRVRGSRLRRCCMFLLLRRSILIQLAHKVLLCGRLLHLPPLLLGFDARVNGREFFLQDSVRGHFGRGLEDGLAPVWRESVCLERKRKRDC